MSLDPRLGHLYFDSTASLEAKEQLRMREVNAREQRHLARATYVLDRARNISERSRRWEHENVRRQINKIKDRTLSLEVSLKQEARRDIKCNSEVSSAPGLVSRTSVFADIPRETKSAPEFISSRHVSTTNGFKRRNKTVIRALLKTYNRCDERRRKSEDNGFCLDQGQVDALERAKMILRGTDAEQEVADILDRTSCSKQRSKNSVDSKSSGCRTRLPHLVKQDVVAKRNHRISNNIKGYVF